jgi:hypothetical protein
MKASVMVRTLLWSSCGVLYLLFDLFSQYNVGVIDMCSDQSSCKSCLAFSGNGNDDNEIGCGWCNNQLCLPGTAIGPLNITQHANCQQWLWGKDTNQCNQGVLTSLVLALMGMFQIL